MMKKKLYLIFSLLLAGVFVVSMGMVIRQQLQYKKNAASYAGAAQLAGFKPPKTVRDLPGGSQEESDPVTQALEAVNLAALQEVNPDVLGWIYIPDTELSYPLVQGKNNEYYLYHSWDKSSNSGGAIFLDYGCTSDFEGFNTVIYGHRMFNNSMFGTLKYYEKQSFWQEHPTVYIVDGSGVHPYDIFAAWEPSVTSAVYSRDYDTERKRQDLLDACLKNNRLDTGIEPDSEDKILTLSTCTASGHATRWVVHAVERIK